MQHIIVDLEFTPVEKKDICKKLMQETIEIGAVKLDGEYRIVDSFDVYVKPEHSCVTKEIRNLTGIDGSQLESAPSFDEALDMLTAWIGDDAFRIYQWSENDKYQIVKECRYKGVEKKQSVLCDKHWRDIQRLYTRVFRKSRKPSLEYALTEVSVGIEGRMHCARDDARNTAYLLQTMAIKEKYLKAKEHIDKYVDTPKHSATIGEIIGVDLSALYALCEETQ